SIFWFCCSSTSIHFPYTTLFRSHPGDVGGEEVGGELDPGGLAFDGAGERLGEERLAHPRHVLDDHVPLGEEASQHQVDHRALALDRKSTRLNSSHAKISYHVFCL